MLQLHIGKTEPSPGAMAPIMNRQFIKPFGGFWTSSYLGEAEGSDWVQWCLSNEFGYGIDNDFPAWLLHPIKNPNLLVVDKYADLDNVMKGFGYPIYEGSSMFLLDYERIKAAGFDGFRVTERGRAETHLSMPYNLYGYDCESTIWFRWCFERVEKLGVRGFSTPWG